MEPATFWLVAHCLNQLRHRVLAFTYARARARVCVCVKFTHCDLVFHLHCLCRIFDAPSRPSGIHHNHSNTNQLLGGR
jgi:hypothetical protein